MVVVWRKGRMKQWWCGGGGMEEEVRMGDG